MGVFVFCPFGGSGGALGALGGADINMHEYDRTRGKKPDPRVVLRVLYVLQATAHFYHSVKGERSQNPQIRLGDPIVLKNALKMCPSRQN